MADRAGVWAVRIGHAIAPHLLATIVRGRYAPGLATVLVLMDPIDAVKALPDTVLVREAAALAEAALSPAVLAHSRRTFLLGRAYGERRGIAVDEEGLLLAALFHDFGLADSLRDRRRAFTEVSAASLRSFLDERGDPRAGVLGEAIALHMQLFPRWSRGPEVGLLQVGAWMDGLGLRRRTVGRDLVREIEASHPRDGLDRELRRRIVGSLGSWRACVRLLVPPRELVSSQARFADRGPAASLRPSSTRAKTSPPPGGERSP